MSDAESVSVSRGPSKYQHDSHAQSCHDSRRMDSLLPILGQTESKLHGRPTGTDLRMASVEAPLLAVATSAA